MIDPADCPGLAALGTLARNAAARADVATVRWEADGETLAATAKVHTDGRGCLLVLLDERSALVAATERHPVLTVVVAAGDPWSVLLLEGVAHRLPVARGATFRIAPSALVLLGDREQRVPTEAYYAAEPEPTWDLAPAVVDHLARTHAEQLTHVLRHHGCTAAESVVPVALSPDGLQVAVLDAAGVDSLRVRFPEPASTLTDALLELRTLLACSGC